ncbi:MAG: ferritin-like domain-containing protein [Actinomycetota bacterium]|nr:ferritin-like domain-containing protein [Actinomycetota bacterium]
MSTLVDAWQRALGAEQQAVFGYALAGSRLDPDTGSELAHTCQSEHETLRATATAALIAARAVPTPPPADFPALYPVRDARSAHGLAVRLEQDAAAAWRYLYAVAAETPGASAAPARTRAQAALIASAVRATRWRLRIDPAKATVAFPGI